MDLKLIIDSFSAISVMLVFVVMLFSLRYPIIIKDMDMEIPEIEKTKKRERERKRLKHSLVVNCVPQIAAFGIIAYLFLPLTINIINNTRLCIWNFDFIITVFMFVVVSIWFFFIWSFILGLKIFCKMRRIKIKK